MQSIPWTHSINAMPKIGVVAWRRVIQEIAASETRTTIQGATLFAYILSWVMFPIFQVLTIGLLYYNNPGLRTYGVVAGIVEALIFSTIFGASEVLDNERQRGTLGSFFLSPTPRFVWLAGFQLYAFTQAILTATLAVVIGVVTFDISLDINPLPLVITLLLTLATMWGLSMILGAIGVLTRSANMISNLVFPIFTLFGGFMYPIDRMPDAVRIPARCLPFGYSAQAFVDSITKGASLGEMGSDLLPLIGFAILLPVLGIFAFQTVERAVRRMGYLDLA